MRMHSRHSISNVKQHHFVRSCAIWDFKCFLWTLYTKHCYSKGYGRIVIDYLLFSELS